MLFGQVGMAVRPRLWILVFAAWGVVFGQQRPPVILIDGYHLLCQPENLTSAHDFGELEQRLTSEGLQVYFFGTCSFNGKPSIEDMGNGLGATIRNLNVPQVDLISHSMGGLIVRAYLSGKQNTPGAFTPPVDTQVRKWVSIATPNFGALLPGIITGFLPDQQAQELVPGNQFLFDLATWNQNHDDLRGVDTIGIVGNAGGIWPFNGQNDGTVAVTSASMSFALPDQRTRVVPYCHGAGDLTGILGLGCNAPPIAKIQSDNPLSWSIIDSFLNGTASWQSVGHSPSQDGILSQYGGVLTQPRNAADQPTGPIQDQPFATNPPRLGGYTVVINKPGPRISNVVPSDTALSGFNLAPGIRILINGSNLDASTVTLNGQTLALNSSSPNQVDAVLPDDVSGLAKLTVKNSQGLQTVNVWVVSNGGLAFAGSWSHLAAAGTWDTTFYLVGTGPTAAQARFSQFADNGGPLSTILSFPQQSATLLASSISRTIAPNSLLIVGSTGLDNQPVQIGSAQLATAGKVDGFAIFRLTASGQEAAVPLETRNANSYVLAFDNTGGMALGVAVENISAQAAAVGVVIRDDTGAQIGTGSLSLAGSGHTSFVLSTQFPVTANRRGTIEFNTASGGQISALGIRFTGQGIFTTIPVLANVGPGGGSIAHIASGGGWKTTFVLVNAGSTTAQTHLSFFDDNGNPLPLPLSFPQSGANAASAASLDWTLASQATFIVESQGPDLNPVQVGSVQLTTGGLVSGFVIFRYTPSGQEAVVPLESRNAPAYVLAFDNTGGIATGVAVSNISAQAASVGVIIRNEAGVTIGTGSLSLAANGHSAFTLAVDKFPVTAGIRGTIEFDAPAGGQIGVLGIRITQARTFTTLPALIK